MMDGLPVFELDSSHDYSDEDCYGSSGKSFYESQDKGGKSKIRSSIHRHHPYDGRLVLHSGEEEPYDGHLGFCSGEVEPYDGRLGLRSGGETSVFFSQSATASDVNFNIPKKEDPEKSKIELVIVAVTAMNGGKCLMGLDQGNEFRRPIYKTEVADCCWPKEKYFKLWNRYKFTKRSIDAATDLPHSREDTLVQENVEDLRSRSDGLFERMLRIAKSKPEDLFPPLKYQNGKIFVDEKTDCPSVGVLKSKESNLEIKTEYDEERKRKKSRLIMKFPGQLSCSASLTGFGYEKPGGTDNTVLVLLGLARPFDKYGTYDPARCYVLALNIIKQ